MHAGNDNDECSHAKIVLSFPCLLHEEYRIGITDSWWALASSPGRFVSKKKRRSPTRPGVDCIWAWFNRSGIRSNRAIEH